MGKDTISTSRLPYCCVYLTGILRNCSSALCSSEPSGARAQGQKGPSAPSADDRGAALVCDLHVPLRTKRHGTVLRVGTKPCL